MARKRRGQPVHGWVNIDKPLGMSSTKVVGRVRWLFDAQKAGHGGTLDPLASGVLPIALGEATKTVNYAVDGTKEYEFVARWGQATTTDDREGEVTETSENRPEPSKIEGVLPEFLGTIEQIPPAYSAIKIDGKRAYELARADKTPEMKSRTVEIFKFELVETLDPDHFRFRVECGKGTYIRSLARDLGKKLGTCAHVSELIRTRVGCFEKKHAISLDYLESLGHSARHSEALLSVEAVLDDIPALALTTEMARKLKHGQSISIDDVADLSFQPNQVSSDTICVKSEGKLIALAKVLEGQIKPLRVLNH